MQLVKIFERGRSSPDRYRFAVGRLRKFAGPLKRLAGRVPVARRVAVVEVAFVLALAALSADLLWTVFAPSTYASQSTVSIVAEGASETYAKRANIALLTTTDLFHREQVPGGAAARVVNAPATQLNLDLFGVRFGGATRGDSAIIRTPNNTQDVYLVGGEVMEGVRLERVLQDRVIIRRNGIAESLFLDKEQQARVAALVRATEPPNTDANHNFSGSVNTLLARVEFLPRDGGSGVIIKQRGDGEVLTQMGLSTGDILIAINETPVSGLNSINSLANTLRGTKEIVLTLERNGRSETRRIVMENNNVQ